MSHTEQTTTESPMSRRGFVGAAAAAAVGVSSVVRAAGAAPSGGGFKLRYAPNSGSFNAHAGKDPIDNIKFMADQGFRALFDNGFPRKDPALQEKIAKHLHKKGYDGALCMEHGRSIKGKEGEVALIEAYRAADDSEV